MKHPSITNLLELQAQAESILAHLREANDRAASLSSADQAEAFVKAAALQQDLAIEMQVVMSTAVDACNELHGRTPLPAGHMAKHPRLGDVLIIGSDWPTVERHSFVEHAVYHGGVLTVPVGVLSPIETE